MYIFPFLSLPQIETSIFELSRSVNGKTIIFYGWEEYNLKKMPYIVKTNKPIKLHLLDDEEVDGIYIGMLNGMEGKLYYSVDYKNPIDEDNLLITSIYGLILRRNGKLDLTYFSPTIRKFLLQKSFSELIDVIVEKGDSIDAIISYFTNMVIRVANFSLEEFRKFLFDNKLEYVILISDGMESYVPTHYIDEENYRQFNLLFYLSLLFWISYGDIQVKIEEY